MFTNCNEVVTVDTILKLFNNLRIILRNERCYLQNSFFKSKLVDQKGSKIDDVMGLSLNHVFSSNNGNK